jgi:hypothetical protein
MRVRITSLALILVLLLLTPISLTHAKDKNSDGVSVPVAGTFTDAAGGVGKFSGTFTIQRFAAVGGAINAVGVISGTATDSLGNVVATGLQTVSVPITAASGPIATSTKPQQERTVTFTKASFNPSEPRAINAAPVPQASCEILRLSIGAIDLNLLGLTVHLNPVLLIITAVPGPGNLLGNLLCAIANLLNGPGPLAGIIALLNQLLALLSGL